MKKNILMIGLCMLSMVAMGQTKQLTILHTNDTHSQILPLNVTLADTMKAGRAGFVRRIAMLKEERKRHPDLLLFDSGDFSQGSPYYTLFKGDVEVGLMNRMHYDAGTLGNHEFDYGLDNMARVIRNLNFPIVCANYDFTGTACEKLVKPYVILKRNGVKIGVFGLAPQLDGLVDHKNYEPTKYLDPVSTAQRMVDILRREKKCDVVICLSHLGWENSYEVMADELMMSRTRGIDLVLGGHSHSYFKQLEYVKNAEGKLTPNDQNGKHAIYVGKMTLELKKK